MKVRKASACLQSVPFGQQGMLHHVECMGRICYRSEDRMTPESAEAFVKGIIRRHHEAVLEHGSFVIEASRDTYRRMQDDLRYLTDYCGFQSFLTFSAIERFLVSGNIRAWRDFFRAWKTHISSLPPAYANEFLRHQSVWFEDIFTPCSEFLQVRPDFQEIAYDKITNPEEEELHIRRSIIFTCDRGVTHEIVRHRPASYCQESTRYCNYSCGKFEHEITVIKPCFWDEDSDFYREWWHSCKLDEDHYFRLLGMGARPEQARSVLPTSLAATLGMTATLDEWRHFVNLRDAGPAHPQMREVAHWVRIFFQTEYPELFGEPDEQA